MPLYIYGRAYASPPAANSAAYTNFIARTSGLDATHQTAYATLLDGLTTDGIFDGSGNSTTLDGLWIFATQTQTNALLNLVTGAAGHGPCTIGAGSPTFTADSGFTGISQSVYIDSHVNLSTLGGNASQNNIHLSVWDGTSGLDTGAMIATGGGAHNIHTRYTDNNAYFRIGNGSEAGVAVADSIGFYTGNRSGAAAWQGYKSGSQITSGTDSSIALNNSTICFPTSPLSSETGTNHLLMAGSAGGSLTSAQAAALYARVHTFLQTIAGVP